MKITLERLKTRFELTENTVSCKTEQQKLCNPMNKEKKGRNNEQSIRELQDPIKPINVCVYVNTKRRGKRERKKNFEEIMAMNVTQKIVKNH